MREGLDFYINRKLGAEGIARDDHSAAVKALKKCVLGNLLVNRYKKVEKLK